VVYFGGAHFRAVDFGAAHFDAVYSGLRRAAVNRRDAVELVKQVPKPENTGGGVVARVGDALHQGALRARQSIDTGGGTQREAEHESGLEAGVVGGVGGG
jgi:hypothetical protein